MTFDGKTVWTDYVFTDAKTGTSYKVTWEYDKAHIKGSYNIFFYVCPATGTEFNYLCDFMIVYTTPTAKRSLKLLMKKLK